MPQDRSVVLAVVYTLGVLAVLSIGGIVAIILDAQITHSTVESTLLTPIVGIAGTIVGALGALLANTRTSPPEPTPVAQVEPPAAAVPVQEREDPTFWNPQLPTASTASVGHVTVLPSSQTWSADDKMPGPDPATYQGADQAHYEPEPVHDRPADAPAPTGGFDLPPTPETRSDG